MQKHKASYKSRSSRCPAASTLRSRTHDLNRESVGLKIESKNLISLRTAQMIRLDSLDVNTGASFWPN